MRDVADGKFGLLSHVQQSPAPTCHWHPHRERVRLALEFAVAGMPGDQAQHSINISHRFIKEKSNAHLSPGIILADVDLIRVEHDPGIAEIEARSQLHPPFR